MGITAIEMAEGAPRKYKCLIQLIYFKDFGSILYNLSLSKCDANTWNSQLLSGYTCDI